MLEKIKGKLQELDQRVFYGRGEFEEGETWDCTVYGRRRIRKSGTSRLDYTNVYFVAVVREDEVPEGFELDVIAKMKEIGLSVSDASIEFAYVQRASDSVVEMCTIEFSKSAKRVC